MLKKIHSIVVYVLAVFIVNFSFLQTYQNEISGGSDVGYLIALILSVFAVLFAYLVAEFDFKSFVFLICCILVGFISNLYFNTFSYLATIVNVALAILYSRYVVVSENSKDDYFLSNCFTFIGYSMILFLIFVKILTPTLGFIFILFLIRNTLETDKRISLSNGDVKSSIRLETMIFLYVFATVCCINNYII